MKIRIVIAVAAAIAALVLVWILLWVTSTGPSGATSPGKASADSPTGEESSPAIVALEGTDERKSIGTGGEIDSAGSRSAAAAGSEQGRAPSESTLRGRVLDAQGRPIESAGIFVGSFGSDPAHGIRQRHHVGRVGWIEVRDDQPKPTLRIGESGHGGRFELARQPDGTLLHARGEHQVPVLAFECYGSDPKSIEAILVVAAPSAVAGIVVDEQGLPIEGIEVAVLVPEGFQASLGLILDRSEPLEYFTRSGADGRFEIVDAPGIQDRLLAVTREGSPSQEQPIGAGPETSLRIVFQLGEELQAAARGIVLDAKGVPASDASVRLGQASARTGADGRFVVDASAAEPGFLILAAKPGFAPGRAAFDPQMKEFVVRLGAPTLRLAGRVVDGKGRPMAEVEVRALDLTHVDGMALEDMSTWDGTGPFTHDDTDAEGRFEIGGLEPRAYSLGLLDRRTMRTMQTTPIQAGKTDAEIRFEAGDATGRIAGRVVDPGGNPVPSAEVWLSREIARPEGGQRDRLEIFARGDGEGVFEFQDVALDAVSVRVAFPGDLSSEHEFGAGEDLSHLVLVAYRSAHLQVDLTGSDLQADAFGILDRSGTALSIMKHEGNVVTSSMQWPIADQRSDVLTALEMAETVVVYYRNVETSRVPVRLVPGELTVVRP